MGAFLAYWRKKLIWRRNNANIAWEPPGIKILFRCVFHNGDFGNIISLIMGAEMGAFSVSLFHWKVAVSKAPITAPIMSDMMLPKPSLWKTHRNKILIPGGSQAIFALFRRQISFFSQVCQKSSHFSELGRDKYGFLNFISTHTDQKSKYWQTFLDPNGKLISQHIYHISMLMGALMGAFFSDSSKISFQREKPPLEPPLIWFYEFCDFYFILHLPYRGLSQLSFLVIMCSF